LRETFAVAARRPRQLRAEALSQIERVGLSDIALKPAGSISLGQQRIVEVARALCADPLLLLLDEPAAGLRHQERAVLTELLARLRSEGLSILGRQAIAPFEDVFDFLTKPTLRN